MELRIWCGAQARLMKAIEYQVVLPSGVEFPGPDIGIANKVNFHGFRAINGPPCHHHCVRRDVGVCT